MSCSVPKVLCAGAACSTQVHAYACTLQARAHTSARALVRACMRVCARAHTRVWTCVQTHCNATARTQGYTRVRGHANGVRKCPYLKKKKMSILEKKKMSILGKKRKCPFCMATHVSIHVSANMPTSMVTIVAACMATHMSIHTSTHMSVRIICRHPANVGDVRPASDPVVITTYQS